MEKFDLIVVGAGPAGLMATISARKRNKRVLLLEQNREIGCKLKISGGGRCNLTNTLEPGEFLNRFKRWKNFFLPSFRAFDNQKTIRFFEENGLALKVEESGRVFPKTGKSIDVIRFFSQILKLVKAEVKLGCKVIEIDKADDVFRVKSSRDEVYSSNVLIATGGVSFASKCHTRGDGFKWAKRFGHTVTRLVPHLCEVYTKEDVSGLRGITLHKVRVKHRCERHNIDESGPLIFTDRGLSGPLIHNLSMYLLDCLGAWIILDFVPHRNLGEVTQEIGQLRKIFPTRMVWNLPIAGLPERLIKFVLRDFCGRRAASLSKKEIQGIAERFKHWKLSIEGGPPVERAFVTAGGVSVEEVDRKKLESKLVKGLFFAGEVLEVAGPSGGFNIQFALSTGWAVGNAV